MEEGKLGSAMKCPRCSTGWFEESNTACTRKQDDMAGPSDAAALVCCS